MGYRTFLRMIALTAAAAGLMSTGCSSGSNDTLHETVSATGSSPTGLSLKLQEEYGEIAADGSQTYTLAISNQTSQPITIDEIHVPGSTQPDFPTASVTVSNSSGNPITTASSIPGNSLVTPQTVTATIDPGRSISEQLLVSKFPAGGTYTATASFTITNDSNPTAAPVNVGPVTVSVD